jgi:hypothetical protein
MRRRFRAQPYPARVGEHCVSDADAAAWPGACWVPLTSTFHDQARPADAASERSGSASPRTAGARAGTPEPDSPHPRDRGSADHLSYATWAFPSVHPPRSPDQV